jgi:FkbM family methyltransferase
MMKLKTKIKLLIEKYLGYKIYRKLPFGVSPLNDIEQILKDFKIQTILDVGANIGQSTMKFIKSYPYSEIYCIEPVSNTFNQLLKNTNSPNVKCYQLALGSENGNSEIKVYDARCDMNSLLKSNIDIRNNDYRIEKIEVQTLTDFCLKNKINHINYLKIDTEGFDLEVLKGGKELLVNKVIDLIEIEVGMNCQNKYHINMFDVKEYLESRNYYIFGIYEQVQEWIIKKPILRRCNALFISQKIADRN